MKQVLCLLAAGGVLLLIFVLTPPLVMQIAPGFWLSYPPARSWDRLHETLLTMRRTRDHGKRAAAKASLHSLRATLLTYHQDLGRFPHTGSEYTARSIQMADESCLGLIPNCNVLMNPEVSFPFGFLGKAKTDYQKCWKGPYLDDEPQYAMCDPWDKKIRYTWSNGSLWLQSGGEDTQFDQIEEVIHPAYSGNDLALRIATLTFELPGAHPAGAPPTGD
ncbi:MAG TPA: hypothetical protein PKO06_14590 [Candidatus Ozemobacteraceae bacterium]|nr:hypothetical protein [Candidatus Ozemobacteraceae bacterium]